MARIMEIKRDLQQLKKEERALSRALAKDTNDGRRLEISSNGQYSKWFVKEDGKKTYLPKSERDQAVSLAKSAWNKARLAEVRAEITGCQRYLNSFRGKTTHMKQLMGKPGFCDLLGQENTSAAAWAKAEYNKNPSHPEHLKFHTKSGLLLRSKSEAMIATMLEKYSIPFRYECQMDTSTGPIYPDFTILSPVTGKQYIWEHFGMVDNPSYAASVGQKLYTYAQLGYIPDENLILTYESHDHPLEPYRIEAVIRQYFLSEEK
ncbi:MAG: hypothetical protein VZQ80_08495 [Lachnospiraceae bacterium]|nr:hypothetical protein [Lachnospiraceae bacterium]